jgi:N-acetylglucosaminyldiphosphoundecaprenol N-acetyl-beta-D-mannosaminyltransferase
VGLGAPKQDLWVAEHRSRLDAAALLAVGAAFDFHAGRRRRAPRWMQRSGTEWLFRLVTEPRRLAGRYTRVNARFLRLVVEEWRHRRS